MGSRKNTRTYGPLLGSGQKISGKKMCRHFSTQNSVFHEFDITLSFYSKNTDFVFLEKTW